MTAIDESLVEIAENVNVYYFEDSAKAHNTKPFSDSENELVGTERTRDIVELLKQLNCLRHLCTLSTVTSWRSSPTEGFFNFASPKEKSKTAHPVQATRKKRHSWHSRNTATNNFPSARCFAKSPNRKFPDVGSPATNGAGIQWKQNLSLLTHELR